MSQTYPAYRGLRFEEEYALEQMLSGLTVPNAKNQAIPVNVFWKDPARELHQMRYPAIMLEFLDIIPRRNEEHRGLVQFAMEPYTGNYLSTDHSAHVTGEFPLPVLLYYQATVFSRVQQHDVIINDWMATTFVPSRYGQLNCPSGTCRRLDFESMVNRDTIDGESKRVFAKLWTFSVSAEIVPSQWPAAIEVTEFDITVSDTTTGEADPTIIDRP